MTLLANPMPVRGIKSLQKISRLAKTTRATCEDAFQHYRGSLLPPTLYNMLPQAIHLLLTHAPLLEWSTTLICYTKGDKHNLENYRPIYLMQTVVKLSTSLLTELTHQHKLVHGC